MSLRVAVLASGGGTNLQSLLDRLDPAFAGVALVVSDRPDAGALARATSAGVPTHVLEHARGAEGDVARELLATLEAAGTDLVVLAGYVRKVPAAVVRAFTGRMVNIHPALLPAFGGRGMYGRRVHEAVIAAGCRVSGATVHVVDDEYDRGPILAQWPVPVWPTDTPATLAARVLRVEHQLLPAAVEALAWRLSGGVDGAEAPGRFVGGPGDEPDGRGIRRMLGLE